MDRPDRCWVCGFDTYRLDFFWQYPTHEHCDKIAWDGYCKHEQKVEEEYVGCDSWPGLVG